MRDSVGKFLAQGIGIGFTDEMSAVENDVIQAFSAVTDSLETKIQAPEIELKNPEISDFEVPEIKISPLEIEMILPDFLDFEIPKIRVEKPEKFSFESNATENLNIMTDTMNNGFYQPSPTSEITNNYSTVKNADNSPKNATINAYLVLDKEVIAEGVADIVAGKIDDLQSVTVRMKKARCCDMTEEFCMNGVHSYQTFGLKILERKIGSAPKDDMTERVPFSSMTYDFSRIFGKNSYDERMISYELEFVCMNKKIAQERIIEILKKLKWDGRKNLYDNLLCDYHYEVCEPEIDFSENHGVYNFKIKFPANPEIKPNASVVLPDVDGDRLVNSIDASLILDAYSKIGTGETLGNILSQSFSVREETTVFADISVNLRGIESSEINLLFDDVENRAFFQYIFLAEYCKK